MSKKRRQITERVFSERFLRQANAVLVEWGASTCWCGAELLRDNETVRCDGEEHKADICTQPDK